MIRKSYSNDQFYSYRKVLVLENIFIPKKAKHRVLNESAKKNLVIIEVQTGTKFIESDIKRYSDIYGRNKWKF